MNVPPDSVRRSDGKCSLKRTSAFTGEADLLYLLKPQPIQIERATHGTRR